MAKKDPVKRIVAQILQIEDQAEKVKQEYIRGMREIIEHEQSKNMGILDKIKDLKDKEIKKMDKDTQDLLKKMKKKARAEERKKIRYKYSELSGQVANEIVDDFINSI